MSDRLVQDLQMAELSVVKVADLGEKVKEAKESLSSYHVSVEMKDRLQTALDTIQNSEDYEITPAIVKQVDSEIGQLGGLSIKKGIIRIDGTENFGLTLSPRDWKASRVAGLESLLDDTFRDIKRWANKLQENFQRRWIELTSSLEVLESRVEALQNALDTAGLRREGMDTVEYPQLVVRSLTRSNGTLTTDLAKNLTKDIDYFSTVMKFYETEMSKFQGLIVKHYGTPKADMLSDVQLNMPRILDIRFPDPDDADDRYISMASRPLLGGRRIVGRTLNPRWVKKNYNGPSDNEMYVLALGETGFHLTASDHTAGSAKIGTLSLTQLFTLLEIAKELINYIKLFNNEFNKLDMDKYLVKDNLETLKRDTDNHSGKAAQYQHVVSDYQYNLNQFRSEVSAYLAVLASHVLTALSLNLECYDAE